MEYRIIGAKNLAKLEEAMNNCITDGWQPFGSIFSYTDSTIVHHGIVKYATIKISNQSIKLRQENGNDQTQSQD